MLAASVSIMLGPDKNLLSFILDYSIVNLLSNKDCPLSFVLCPLSLLGSPTDQCRSEFEAENRQ